MAARADYTVVDEPIMVEVVVVAIVIEQMAAVKVETEVDGRAEVAAVVVDKAIAQMVVAHKVIAVETVAAVAIADRSHYFPFLQ